MPIVERVPGLHLPKLSHRFTLPTGLLNQDCRLDTLNSHNSIQMREDNSLDVSHMHKCRHYTFRNEFAPINNRRIHAAENRDRLR